MRMCTSPAHAVEEAEPQQVELAEPHERRERRDAPRSPHHPRARGARPGASCSGSACRDSARACSAESCSRSPASRMHGRGGEHAAHAPCRRSSCACAAVEEPHAPVGIAFAVPQPAAEEAVAARHRVDEAARGRRARPRSRPAARRSRARRHRCTTPSRGRPARPRTASACRSPATRARRPSRRARVRDRDGAVGAARSRRPGSRRQNATLARQASSCAAASRVINTADERRAVAQAGFLL